MTDGSPVKFSEYHDRPQRLDSLWTLRKREHMAECSLWTHPIGGEIRVEAAGDFVRSEASRDGLALIELALTWRTQFLEKGWTA